jgi:hypothetical protein
MSSALILENLARQSGCPGTPFSGERAWNIIRTRIKFLEFVPVLFYSTCCPKREERRKNVGLEVNFHLGEDPVQVDTPLTLDPNLVRLVKALARRAARQDFEANIEK